MGMAQFQVVIPVTMHFGVLISIPVTEAARCTVLDYLLLSNAVGVMVENRCEGATAGRPVLNVMEMYGLPWRFTQSMKRVQHTLPVFMIL